ncbi:THAP domain-containing protein 4-like [Pecten maximus]|uniref:THAP domain-containing protein 4-like n=1 Tax=Pecten maximus TaxID=6579 RepID=UPI0014586EB4|nr:THAP domain-containing protein 4-like [Pecten maximus]XP_033760334.1 THAP domain-containing protein 4-like [Pecten maximus]XP_033760335.1 THAP domain-containing protein 4-like [Pecten maximus]XP_033760336.1 THAP domain-containing protein 4-like [Pecten maximus]XP_033760337.1 THAP domain-containing protein 4-like [Pecten maximus]
MRMSADTEPPIHDMIKPLSWLLGKWKGEGGVGKYPTIEDFTYDEELTFSHVGQPNIQFSFFSSHSKTKKPLHRELGFIRFKPGTNQCALLIAHNLGVSEVEEGEFTDTEMRTESHTVGRLSFGKPPETKKIKRVFSKIGDDLEQVVSMETANTPMTEHLRITYKRVAS